MPNAKIDSAVLVAVVQAFLTLVIALCSGWWAYQTQRLDREISASREHERLARIAEQESMESRAAQAEAISQMSRQLGLMEALCNENARLRTLLDGSDGPVSRRVEQCHDAYIGARSLLFLSEVRILPNPKVKQDEWKDLWDTLKKTLRNAGAIGYNPQRVGSDWSKIVGRAR